MGFPVLLGLVLLLGTGAAAGEELHLKGSGTWATTPTLPESMTRRIEDAAIEYQQYGPVQRIGFFDIALPATPSEFQETGGYGALLLTVFSQESSELPPRRVFVNLEGKQHVLELIAAARTPQAPSPDVARVLGANRWDALYGFPVHLMQDGATLSMDFAKNRDGFEFGSFSTAERAGLGYGALADDPPRNVEPASDALVTLIQREYPGFLLVAP